MLHIQVIILDSCLLSPVITALCRSYKQVPYNMYNIIAIISPFMLCKSIHIMVLSSIKRIIQA